MDLMSSDVLFICVCVFFCLNYLVGGLGCYINLCCPFHWFPICSWMVPSGPLTIKVSLTIKASWFTLGLPIPSRWFCMLLVHVYKGWYRMHLLVHSNHYLQIPARLRLQFSSVARSTSFCVLFAALSLTEVTDRDRTRLNPFTTSGRKLLNRQSK